MQEKKQCDDQELICINVDKVYDWIVKEKSFDIFPTGPINFPGILPTTNLLGATVTCDVVPATTMEPIVILSRENRPLCIDGKNVLLQQLNIQKNFDVTIYVTVGNAVYASELISVSRCEQVTLCAPEGTDVEITYTDLDCFVCGTGTLTPYEGAIEFTALAISVASCQSIQSTFPVTVEFLAEYCEPRDDFPTACMPPTRPQPCSVVFPNDGHGHCCH